MAGALGACANREPLPETLLREAPFPRKGKEPIVRFLRTSGPILSLLTALAVSAFGGETEQAQRSQPSPTPAPKAIAPMQRLPATPRAGTRARVSPTVSAQIVRFKQLEAQARAAKPPGAEPGRESQATLQRLQEQYSWTSRVEAENARLKARLPGPPTWPTRSPGDPPDVDVPGPDSRSTDIGPNPCGDSFELKAIQATPPLDPGELVQLEGCGFGPYPPGGEVRLVGDFPGGYLKLHISGWGPTSLLMSVPMVTGVPDMPAAKLQVVRHDGKFSNWLDVGGFRATKEVRLIHPNDVVITCWLQPAPCGFAKSHPLSEAGFFGGATFASKRIKTVDPDTCGDTALAQLGEEHTDLAAVNLYNAWVLAGYAWGWDGTGNAWVKAPEGFAANSSSATIKMTWGLQTDPCDGPHQSNLRYRVDLYAVGPKGVPYK
jgi:hypothetical protein